MSRLSCLSAATAALALFAGTAAAQGCSAVINSLYSGTNGGAVGGAVYFDVTILGAGTVTFTGIDVNTTVALGAPIALDGVYTIAGTSVGNQTNQAAWTLQAVDNGLAVSAGLDLPSHIDFAVPFVLTGPGTFGFAIDAQTYNHRYTTGNGANGQFSDGVLQLDLGSASNVAFTGGIFSPRLFNGGLHYSASNALIADFSADAPTGTALPHVVNFTSQVCTTNPPVLTYDWDLDGDGTFGDSSAQNPQWVYVAAGSYDVSLRVTDAVTSVTQTKSNLINVILNDECAGAIPVGYGVTNGFNFGATGSVPAYTCVTAGADVWYVFTPLTSQSVRVSLCGSLYDTSVEILDGSLGCGSLTVVACNDDFCGTQSEATFAAIGGVPYYIRVGGWADSMGAFTMDISSPGSFTSVSLGCGTTTLAASGTPALGGAVSYTLTPGSAVSAVWLGFTPSALPLCATCTVGCALDVAVPGNSLNLVVPNVPVLIGGSVYCQGVDLLGVGGCFSPFQAELSDTILTVIGS